LKPYTELSNNQVIERVLKNKDRKLLEKPEICPDTIYEMMISCWALDSEDRPTFKEILKNLENAQERGPKMEESDEEGKTDLVEYVTTTGNQTDGNQTSPVQVSNTYANMREV